MLDKNYLTHSGNFTLQNFTWGGGRNTYKFQDVEKNKKIYDT